MLIAVGSYIVTVIASEQFPFEAKSVYVPAHKPLNVLLACHVVPLSILYCVAPPVVVKLIDPSQEPKHLAFTLVVSVIVTAQQLIALTIMVS
jgi:hypothetical protein